AGGGVWVRDLGAVLGPDREVDHLAVLDDRLLLHALAYEAALARDRLRSLVAGEDRRVDARELRQPREPPVDNLPQRIARDPTSPVLLADPVAGLRVAAVARAGVRHEAGAPDERAVDLDRPSVAERARVRLVSAPCLGVRGEIRRRKALEQVARHVDVIGMPQQRRRVRGNDAPQQAALALQDRQGQQLGGRRRNHGVPYIVSENSSRPISLRRISLVPAPISYSLASRHSRPSGYSLI